MCNLHCSVTLFATRCYTFCTGVTLALLSANQNRVHFYMSDRDYSRVTDTSRSIDIWALLSISVQNGGCPWLFILFILSKMKAEVRS